MEAPIWTTVTAADFVAVWIVCCIFWRQHEQKVEEQTLATPAAQRVALLRLFRTKKCRTARQLRHLTRTWRTFSKGAFCPCAPEARDPSSIPLAMKDGKATRYTGTPNRVFCRPFLSLSR